MADYFFLSERDKNTLLMFLEDFRNRPRAASNRGRNEAGLPDAQEVYLARTPHAGIPASGVPSGTGTSLEETPGSALCHVFNLRNSGEFSDTGFKEVLYNPTRSVVSGWCLAVRDKWGTWIAVALGAASGGGGGTFSGARVGLNNLAIPDSTPTLATFNIETFDTDNYFDVGTPTVFTAPEDGYYLAGAVVVWATGNAVGRRSLSVQATAGDAANYDTDMDATGLSTPAQNAAGLFQLSAGDTVAVNLYHEDGSSLDAVEVLFWIVKTSSGSGTGGSYTDENAQDAVGGILADTATVDATYNDATPSISFDVKNGSITLAKIANAAASSKLVGSGASGSGAAYSEITLGTGLSMSGTTLNASGGSPGGADTQVQINDSGAFYGDSGFVYNKTLKQVTVTDGTNTVIFCGSSVYAVQASAGYIRTLGTAGNTFFWKNTTAAPTPQTLGALPFNVYGQGTITDLLGDPDAWLLVNINGTNYKIPAYL